MTSNLTTKAPANLTGKYRKPKNFTKEQAEEELKKLRMQNMYTEYTHIECLVAHHFASEVDDSSYSDGYSCSFDNLTVTVCVDLPEVYEIIYRVETCDSDDNSYDEETEELTEIIRIFVNIKAWWHCEQNVLWVQVNEPGNIRELLKKFKTKPKIVSEEIFRCILAY